MNRTLRTLIRKYHVPYDTKKKFFPLEDNLFGEVQKQLSTQLNVQKVVITITNPNYVCKETSDNNTPYSVDLHYRHKRYVNTFEGVNCENIVRQSIEYINIETHNTSNV